ncbi:MAG: hypothetical protein FLDDKLPJ_00796 [Phycisphaerae bacterium]|nr:hypothetical protein [Phycisphaerae bacterium]
MSTVLQAGQVSRSSNGAWWNRSPSLHCLRCVRVCIAGVLLGVAAVSLAVPQRASAQDCSWEQKNLNFSPSARYNHALTYDTDRRVTVLFGGYHDGGRRDSETWTWNGSNWNHMNPPTGPSARSGHAMTYDLSRGVTVLFGGNDGLLNGETWIWNGAAWEQYSITGPSPRESHAMAYDFARQVTVLFGGYVGDGSYNGETWEWDGRTWMLVSTNGPSARGSHAMTYDWDREVTVLFGGWDGTFNGETWEWDGHTQTWRQRNVMGPSPRYEHAMVYDRTRQATLLFGGYAVGDRLDGETWGWDGDAWRKLTTTGPSRRRRHAMAFDSDRSVTALFGGFDGSQNGETWEYFFDCNCNGVPDHKDIDDGTSADRNGNGIPDECEPCEFIQRFKVKTKENRGRCRIRASVLTTLREGTELTFCFEGDEDCGCQTVTINDRGRAKASCTTLNKGDHRVCIQECPELCRTVTCRP